MQPLKPSITCCAVTVPQVLRVGGPPRVTKGCASVERFVAAPKLSGLARGFINQQSKPTRPTKQKAAYVVAFLKSEETVQVALDAYKILGVSRIATKDTVTKAYDSLVAESPDRELSQELLCSRAIVLKTAADTLLDMATRRAFDHDGMLEIPSYDLPGAIALLTEAGDWVTALEWGNAWLDSNSGDVCAKDVAVCLAISHCDQAAFQIERSLENALECAAGLKQGLALLKKYGSGKDLQKEIQGTLQELRPKVALQMVSQPDEGSGTRAQGIALLRDVLWREGTPVTGFPVLKMSRGIYLEAVRENLTASEQMRLYEGNLSGTALSDEEVYSVALAYLAAGLHSYTPAHVKTAAVLIQELDNKREPATGRKRFDALDVSVESSVCHLLLGEVDEAEMALGLGDLATRSADAGVKQFVQSQCAEGSTDLLPGLYSLAQQWMADVAADRFPELRETEMNLDAWFNNPRVSLSLQVADKSKQLQLAGAGAVRDGAWSFFSRMLGAIAAFLAVLLSPIKFLTRSSSPRLPVTEVDQAAALSNVIPSKSVEQDDTVTVPRTSGANLAPVMAASDLTSNAFARKRAAEREFGDKELETEASAGNDAQLMLETDHEYEADESRAGREAGLPLTAVSNHTVGEIQQHFQDSMPLEEEEDGFSTEYMDAPIPQPPPRKFYRQTRDSLSRSFKAPVLLDMDGEREMWVSYQDERRRAKFASIFLALACLGLAVWTVLGQNHFIKRNPLPFLQQAARIMRTNIPLAIAL